MLITETLCYSKDEKYLFSSTEDSQILVWNVDQNEIIKILIGHRSNSFIKYTFLTHFFLDYITAMISSIDGKYMYSSSFD